MSVSRMVTPGMSGPCANSVMAPNSWSSFQNAPPRAVERVVGDQRLSREGQRVVVGRQHDARVVHRVVDQVVLDRVAVAAVDRDAVGAPGQLDGVVDEVVVVPDVDRLVLDELVGPDRQRVVAGVAERRVEHPRVARAVGEVDAVGVGVADAHAGELQPVARVPRARGCWSSRGRPRHRRWRARSTRCVIFVLWPNRPLRPTPPSALPSPPRMRPEPKMAMSEICVLSSMSKPKLPSCGWLMLPAAFCGSVSVYSWECHMPAPRMVTLRMPTWLYCPRFSGSSVRIFCSCRHWPGRDPDAADLRRSGRRSPRAGWRPCRRCRRWAPRRTA